MDFQKINSIANGDTSSSLNRKAESAVFTHFPNFPRPKTWRRELRGLFLMIAAAWLAQAAVVVADDESLRFLQGLRERGYFDTAVEYLDELNTSNTVSPAVREVLQLQRGITFQEMGSNARVPEDREQYLSQAEAAYRRFLADQPGHEQTAFANSSLGELLFERARTMIWQTESPSNADKKT